MRKRRLANAKEFVAKDEIWLNNVIFNDESKFNVFESNRHKMVWRKQNEEFESKNSSIIERNCFKRKKE